MIVWLSSDSNSALWSIDQYSNFYHYMYLHYIHANQNNKCFVTFGLFSLFGFGYCLCDTFPVSILYSIWFDEIVIGIVCSWRIWGVKWLFGYRI